MGFFDLVASPVADFAKGILNRFWPEKMTEAERAAAEAGLTKLLQEREDRLVSAQRDVLVAELQQDDKYTKRFRPTVGYVVLGMYVVNYTLVPLINQIIIWVALIAGDSALRFSILKPLEIPEALSALLVGICGVYIWKRGDEKIASIKNGGGGGNS